MTHLFHTQSDAWEFSFKNGVNLRGFLRSLTWPPLLAAGDISHYLSFEESGAEVSLYDSGNPQFCT